MATWAGQRFTKFTDVTLTFLAPAVALQISGLGQQIFDTLTVVARALLAH